MHQGLPVTAQEAIARVRFCTAVVTDGRQLAPEAARKSRDVKISSSSGGLAACVCGYNWLRNAEELRILSDTGGVPQTSAILLASYEPADLRQTP